ncbi:hypothetical protein LWC35_16890 [Pseudonocardia kujensis]|uniref:hypothetical protein n=1 Tax=Pseudonocardia kujensis TaxID=1128675 RepID=UPI001E2FBDA5|nr:hypothetical protein [Pseudonocardia kujensis]MCE0764572.1 hypothetical protein [Pseudonocardia kujensis]
MALIFSARIASSTSPVRDRRVEEVVLALMGQAGPHHDFADADVDGESEISHHARNSAVGDPDVGLRGRMVDEAQIGHI